MSIVHRSLLATAGDGGRGEVLSSGVRSSSVSFIWNDLNLEIPLLIDLEDLSDLNWALVLAVVPSPRIKFLGLGSKSLPFACAQCGTYCKSGFYFYWGLTPQQQPGLYEGGDDDDEMSLSQVEETGAPGGNHRSTASN